MANTDRRYIDKNGHMFIPMNVEGGSWDENFITTGKLIWLVGCIATGVFLFMWLKSKYADLSAYFIFFGVYLIALQFILRFIIFEEKFYYKMYKQMKESEITTPAMFWDIASIKDTPDGAILTFADAKIAVIIRLERDTITGKTVDFKEHHYDAISDFYKEIVTRKYSFIQMNIMEPAGNDPRLLELDKLTMNSDNPNICKLMEKQVGYIKNITHKTLYESEYIMIYTTDITRFEQIVNDTIDSVFKIQEGGYIGYRILNSRDIIEFVKEEFGVKYFDYTDATLEMFRNNGIITDKPFVLSKIVLNNGESQEIGPKELNKVMHMTSGILNGTIDQSTVSIKDTIFSKENRNKVNGIDFNSLSDGIETDRKKQTPIIKKRQKQRLKAKQHEEQDDYISGFDSDLNSLNFGFDNSEIEDITGKTYSQQYEINNINDEDLTDDDDESIDF